MPAFTDSLTLKSGVILPNRLVMAPMTTQQSFYDGTLTQDEIAYYAARAHGLGAVITGAANVQAGGKGWPGELSIASDDMIPGLAQLAGAIKAAGAQPFVQLFHAGRMTHAATLGGAQPVSASAVAAVRPDAEVPRALSTAEIHGTIAAFGEATRRAIVAGFAGVELHGANTYLLQQFFSPHSNRRTDTYGGDRGGRFRFIQAVLDAVFATVDRYATRPFAVTYRVSPEEYETPGIRFADTLWLLNQLRTSRLDAVHLSLNDFAKVSRDPDYRDRSMLAYAHEALTGMPLVGVGGVRNRAAVNAVLANADMVAVGQQLLFDPTWPVKLAAGADETMLDADFAQLVRVTPLNAPLHKFVAARYPSING